jgi:acetyltransferase EpsM
MNQKLIIIGNGGHSKVVADIAKSTNKYEIVGYLDDNPDSESLGVIEKANQFYKQDSDLKFIIAIGNNHVRKQIVDNILCLPNDAFATIIHSSAIISNSSSIKEGTVVMPGAIINADVIIGQHCIINTASVIEHDCIIEDFAHISPKAALAGGVTIREGSHVGIGSSVIPGKTVGSWSIIGAGSTVIKDIPEKCTAVGSPARIIKGEINE